MKRSLVIWAFLATILAGPSGSACAVCVALVQEGSNGRGEGRHRGRLRSYYQAYQKKPTEERYKLSWECTRFSAAAMHVEHGEKLRDNGDYTAALTEFLRAIEIDPSNGLPSFRRTSRPPAKKWIRRLRLRRTLRAPPTRLWNWPRPSSLSRFQTSPDPAHGRGQPRRLPGYRQDGRRQRTLRSRLQLQACPGRPEQCDPLRTGCASWRRFRILSGDRLLRTLSSWRRTRAASTPSSTSRPCRPSICTMFRSRMTSPRFKRRCATCSPTPSIYGVASQNAIVMRATPDELLLAQKLDQRSRQGAAGGGRRRCRARSQPQLMRQIGIQLPQTARHH